LLESPVSRAHTRTRPRAPTNALPRTRARTSSGSRSAEYVNQLSTSSVLPRALRRAATSARPLSSFFRPLLPRCALALSATFVFGSPPPLAAAPATGGLCMLWHRRNSPVFQRPTTAPALFNARRISRNRATRSLSARCLSLHSRDNFSRSIPNEARCRAKFATSAATNLLARVTAKLLSSKPRPGVVSRSSFVERLQTRDKPKEFLRTAGNERVRQKTLNESLIG
jgi:hypothetical protein